MILHHQVQEQEKEIRRLKKELKEAQESNRAHIRLLARIGNQIKTPLQGVLGLCASLQRQTEELSNSEILRCTRVASENLLELVRDILDFSDIQNGTFQIRERWFSLDELLDSCACDILNLAESKHLRFHTRLGPQVQEETFGDPYALKRVFDNLLHNAVKFTEHGQVEFKAHLLERHGDVQRVRFCIKDTGIGISRTRLEEIFEAFPSHARAQSKGLGLAVASQIVGVLGERLMVESQPEIGSQFWFDLDLKSRTSGTTTESVDLPRPLEILLVEDEEITQQVILRMLGDSEHNVALASCGEDALQLMRAQEFDFVLMDVEMPGLGGIETTKAIRERERTEGEHPAVIVAFTSHSSTSQRELYLSCGMDGHLLKPIKRQELLRTLKRTKPKAPRGQSLRTSLPRALSQQGQGARVLIVDDERSNRTLLRNILTTAHHWVKEASTGEQALCYLEQEIFDVVLMDAVMPSMDGFETCAQIKSNPKTVRLPVIFVTGLDDRQEKIKALDVGADDFLSKPVDANLLKVRVRNAAHSKRLFDELQKSFTQLQNLERLRDELAQMLVHDMRSPLTAILGYSQLMEMSPALGAEEREYLKVINAMSTMLREMVSSVLDISRLESNEFPLAKTKVDLASLVSAEIETLSFLMDKPVEMQCPEHLPVYCDNELVRRVFANLLNNARKYNASGKSIKIVVKSAQGSARVEIRDHGPGVPEELRTRIFEKFAQVEEGDNKRPYSSGLGLTFCKLAVEKHGGNIGVEHPPEGTGSIFWFELPLGT